jgi:hypothetical protein
VQVLNFKTGIDFGANGNLKEFSPVGFAAAPDDISTWSEASVAELAFRLPPLRHDLRFAIEVFPFLADGRIARQDCWVFFNGLFAHYQAIKTPVELIFTVVRAILNPGENRLSFALTNATSPSDLKLGNDLRMLGLGFVKLSASDAAAAVPSPVPGTPAAAPDAVRAGPDGRANRPTPNPAAGLGARETAVPARPEPPRGPGAAVPARREPPRKPGAGDTAALARPAPPRGPRARDNPAPARPEPPRGPGARDTAALARPAPPKDRTSSS